MANLTEAQWKTLEYYEKKEEMELLTEEELHGLSYLRLKIKEGGVVAKEEKAPNRNTKLITKCVQVNITPSDREMICRIVENYIEDEQETHNAKMDIISYIQRRLVVQREGIK